MWLDIYVSIYIRTMLDHIDNKTYYDKALYEALMKKEVAFQKENREAYLECVDGANIVWQEIRKTKGEGWSIDVYPLITALFYEVKEEINIPPIMIDRLMDKYVAQDNDDYETRSYNLAEEMIERTKSHSHD